jgi:hypothetical protein
MAVETTEEVKREPCGWQIGLVILIYLEGVQANVLWQTNNT